MLKSCNYVIDIVRLFAINDKRVLPKVKMPDT